MLKNDSRKTRVSWMFLVMASLALPALAGDIPAQLPDPDGKPGDATKPVKVYILAGQSNMVGMGTLSGATNLFNAVYLTADPAAPKGPLAVYRVGNYKVDALTVYGPDGTPTDEPVAQGRLEVAETGVYQINCGSGTIQVEGMPAGKDMNLESGKQYAFTISGFQGDVPRFWMQKMDLLGYGDLEAAAKREGKFPWVVDDEGNWTVRNDVYFQEARVAADGRGCPLTATSNGKMIGPELGFGHVMGTFHDEQVLLIKTAMGNRALGFDFRPPSSGRNAPDNEWEAKEYDLMVEGVRKTLANIENVVPGYQGQGYEMAGFLWFQGHKDSFSPELIDEYEKNLVNLINDVRAEFKTPKMRAVVATVGFGGYRMAEKFLKIHEAQMAVGDPNKHPEFAGTVASVDIRPYWREVAESPKGEDYHYNRNAETYMRIGDAMGRAMVRLLGGTAEDLPQGPRPTVTTGTTTEPTDAEKAAGQKALTPIILDGIAASYIANPRYNKTLLAEANGERPARANQFLRGAMYGLVNCYRAAGIHDHDWKVFGPAIETMQWDYYSFDPPEAKPKDQGNRFRKVTYPAGMENWFSADFDAVAAGWKKGLQPFGHLDGKQEPLGGCDFSGGCGCGVAPKTLWQHEVIMARGTFEVPPLKDGHRYRIVVGGSNHVNAGEGYALYVNGKLLAQSNTGVGMRQGGQPRGGHVYADVRDQFNGGKVTLAITSFLRYNHPRTKPYPPRGHLTVWIEEQKIPPVE